MRRPSGDQATELTYIYIYIYIYIRMHMYRNVYIREMHRTNILHSNYMLAMKTNKL